VKKIALVDLDDSLVELKTPLMHALNEWSGKSIHWDQWHCYDLGKIYNISHADVRNCIQNNKLLHNVELKHDAMQFLNLLKSKNYLIHIVSARAWHDNAYKITLEWLNSRNVPYDALTITNHDVAKIDVVRNFYNKVDLAIDDCFHHIKDYKESGIVKHAVLIHHPWNKNDTHDKVINDIAEAEIYI